MKKRLGISIYPEIVGKDQTLKYIDLAHQYGFTRIFANLLELQNDKQGNAKLEALKDIYTYSKNKGFDVIVDVNPNFYKAFNLSADEIDFFLNLGITGIRLDSDFKGEVEAKLSNNKKGLKIELNASTGIEIADLTLEKGGNPKNIIACHNFYPMRFTALAKERFIELSTRYQERNIRVAAFVTLEKNQKGIGPWNVNEGMPTIEKHRDMDLIDQVNDMLALELIDDIIISQQGTTEKQFASIAKLMQNYQEIQSTNFLKIKAKLLPNISPVEKDIILHNKNKKHYNRTDFTSMFVRSTFSRIDYQNEMIKPNNSGKILKYGDLVIINENLGRYKGELHIILQEIDDSHQQARNLVGSIVDDEKFKLLFIKSPKKFIIIENKSNERK